MGLVELLFFLSIPLLWGAYELHQLRKPPERGAGPAANNDADHDPKKDG